MNDTNIKPIVVGVSEARAMGRWGLTRFYQQVMPELETFLDGKTRKVTVASIERYIATRLAASEAGEGNLRRPPPPRRTGAPSADYQVNDLCAGAQPGVAPFKNEPVRSRRGRPRKIIQAAE